MIIKSLNKLIFVFAIAFAFVSCDEKQFFDEYQSTNGEWKKTDVKKFSFEQNDTINSYNLFVNVRNNSDYPYSNLFLIVKMYNPDGKIIIDTLQYQMANPDGSLLGTGLTDFKNNKLFYRENFKFTQSGNYIFEIEQAVRSNGKIKGDSLLIGISDVGFRVENNN